MIELLVVIAIISVLAALLLPAIKRARLSAKRIVGMNNLRQVGLAIQMYRNDFNDRTPLTANWDSSCCELLGAYNVTNLCFGHKGKEAVPDLYVISNPYGDYGNIMCNINLMCGGGTVATGYGGSSDLVRPFTEVEHPGTCFLIAHGDGGFATWSPTHFDQVVQGTGGTWNIPFAGTGNNIYFVDDHVEWAPNKGADSLWNLGGPGSSNSKWIYKTYLIYGP